MKTLLLLRHAKTEPHGPPDRGRELTARGIAQAQSVGRQLAGQEASRVYVVISPAARTQQTWQHVRQSWQETASSMPAIEETIVEQAYNFSAEPLLHVLQEVPEAEQTILLVGHNPGISQLAVDLLGSELADRPELSKYGALRTGRGVIMSYDGAWADLHDGRCSALGYLQPEVD